MYIPPRKPFQHQQQAFDLSKDRRYFALLMAMRTGKTKVTFDTFGYLEDRGEVSNLAIIAPGGVYENWRKEIDVDLSPDLRSRAFIHVWHSSAGSREKTIRRAFMECRDRPRILIMNVEALSNVEAARQMMMEFVKSGSVLLVIDESTTIKAHDAKRAKWIVDELSWHAEYKRILSGLPSPRSLLDVYMQYRFLHPSILRFNSYFSFRAFVAIMRKQVVSYINKDGYRKTREVPIVVAYHNEEEIRSRIEPHSFRVRLQDVYEMPADKYVTRYVRMTDQQQRMYEEMKKFATAHIEAQDYVTATVVIAQIMRLHQILLGFTTDERGIEHDIPERRTEALIELLREYDGKAIIWCSYHRSIRNICFALDEEFGPDSYAQWWGGNRELREEDETRFKTDPRCRFMVATPDAGRFGRNWSEANLCVYYSSKNDLEHRSQSEERPHMVGKMDPITFVDLLVPGTVDEKIIQALRKKMDMASVITGDNWREWVV